MNAKQSTQAFHNNPKVKQPSIHLISAHRVHPIMHLHLPRSSSNAKAALSGRENERKISAEEGIAITAAGLALEAVCARTSIRYGSDFALTVEDSGGSDSGSF